VLYSPGHPPQRFVRSGQFTGGRHGQPLILAEREQFGDLPAGPQIEHSKCRSLVLRKRERTARMKPDDLRVAGTEITSVLQIPQQRGSCPAQPGCQHRSVGTERSGQSREFMHQPRVGQIPDAGLTLVASSKPIHLRGGAKCPQGVLVFGNDVQRLQRVCVVQVQTVDPSRLAPGEGHEHPPLLAIHHGLACGRVVGQVVAQHLARLHVPQQHLTLVAVVPVARGGQQLSSRGDEAGRFEPARVDLKSLERLAVGDPQQL
jgi:hypothetical protein